jgi:23S rRNA pseudouridine955/2504/2580 synthase
MTVHYVEICPSEDGQRLDNYLFRYLKGVPKSHVYRMIRNGEVRVNKKRAAASTKLAGGDRVRIPPVRMAEEKTVFVSSRCSQQLLENILYEDDALLVLNKPSGIAVHGGSGLSLGVIEALRKIRTDLHYLELVHRLDKETSGCLLMAKKRSSLRAIQGLFNAREVTKTYWAILCGQWQGKSQLIVDLPLEKNTLQSGERVVRVRAEGKAAETRFKLLKNSALAALVEASPKTGRTHQIRVHSLSLGHPILGDKKYGGDEALLLPKARLYLHARAIQFNLNGKSYQFQAELDASFIETLKQLGLQ